MKELEYFIKDGLTINRLCGGYRVFTEKTGWFAADSLDELTFENFMKAYERKEENEEIYAMRMSFMDDDFLKMQVERYYDTDFDPEKEIL